MAEWQDYLTKANDNVGAARILEKRGRYCSAANRAYYAVWQAQLATLLKLAPIKKTATGIYRHPSVINAFQNRFVGQGKLFSLRMVQDTTTLASFRVQADYQPKDISRNDADKCARLCQRVVQRIRSELGN